MKVDYTPYLQAAEDGHIWWLIEDAIRLGAGFLPVCDDNRQLEPRLKAQNQRALVNERTLIGAFGDSRLTIEKPETFERDGFRYVDAAGFLVWLSQYICQKQAKIEFPSELINTVRIAIAKAAAERPPCAPEEFRSLTLALDGGFNKTLDALPDTLRKLVEEEFSPMHWDSLNDAGRRSVALQLDYQRDPATEPDRQFWWDFFERLYEVQAQIKEWDIAETPTATDKSLKEARLKELRQEHERMKLQQRQARGDYFPGQKCSAKPGTSLPTDADFIAYPKAMKMLTEKLNATPEELATWIFLGPDTGGIAAYQNANELNPAPRFYFDCFMGEDYLSPLMACWFRQDDIDRFDPTDRYITGAALIERWSNQPGLRPEAFIRAKIAESRLLDIHPTFGGTRGTHDDDSFPPLESGLFLLAHVVGIEAEDFGADEEIDEPAAGSCHPVIAALIRQYFPVVRDADANDEWWKDKMGDANRYGLLECRVGEGKKGRSRSGGSIWRPDMIAGWLVDRHTNGKEGLPADAARKGLKQFPGCEDVAEQFFPEEE